MTTVYDLITEAMQEIGALALEETPTAAEAQNGLAALNDMLGMWNTESLMVFGNSVLVFPFVAGQSTYTMGTGGNFNTNRPVRIDSAYSRDSQGNDYPIEVTENSELYSDITSKYVQSTLPTILYDDGGFPLKNLYYWPVPSSGAYSAVLWVWGQILAYSNLTDLISLPPGYVGALKTNLAVKLGPRYGKPISPDLRDLATQTKAQIKRINTVVDEMEVDPVLVGQAVAFNYYTGNSGNG